MRPFDNSHSPTGIHSNGGPIGSIPSTKTSTANSATFGTPQTANPTAAATACTNAVPTVPRTTVFKVTAIRFRIRPMKDPPTRSISAAARSANASPWR